MVLFVGLWCKSEKFSEKLSVKGGGVVVFAAIWCKTWCEAQCKVYCKAQWKALCCLWAFDVKLSVKRGGVCGHLMWHKLFRRELERWGLPLYHLPQSPRWWHWLSEERYIRYRCTSGRYKITIEWYIPYRWHVKVYNKKIHMIWYNLDPAPLKSPWITNLVTMW